MNGRLIALVLASFVLFVGILVVAGVVPADAAQAIFNGSFKSSRQFSGTLKETTPLLLCGIAVFVALRAGLFNIGVEGQLLVGALAAAVVGTKVGGVGGILLAIIVAMLVGAAWAWPAAWIKVYRNGHEVISTIMLNNIAGLMTAALVKSSFQSPATESPTTADILPSAQLGPMLQVGQFQLNPALVVAVVLVGTMAWWLKHTVSGFELRATGANLQAARFAGVSSDRVQISAMMMSGAIAGLAGAFMVLAYEHRFYPNFSPGYGFDGLGVALLAGLAPFALIPAALVFGILSQANVQLALIGIPRGISGVLLGLLIIVFAAYRYREAKSNG
jgi:simple sugar transport system permease protein